MIAWNEKEQNKTVVYSIINQKGPQVLTKIKNNLGPQNV